MKPKKTWFVVADGAHARVATFDGTGRRLKMAWPYELAAPHAPNRKFVSDRPGSFADRGPGVHSYTPRHERRDYEKLAFARDVAAAIDAAAEASEFDHLVLIAPPPMLGRLRAMLHEKARRRIAVQWAKDLTHLTLPQLERQVAVLAPRLR